MRTRPKGVGLSARRASTQTGKPARKPATRGYGFKVPVVGKASRASSKGKLEGRAHGFHNSIIKSCYQLFVGWAFIS